VNKPSVDDNVALFSSFIQWGELLHSRVPLALKDPKMLKSFDLSMLYATGREESRLLLIHWIIIQVILQIPVRGRSEWSWILWRNEFQRHDIDGATADGRPKIPKTAYESV